MRRALLAALVAAALSGCLADPPPPPESPIDPVRREPSTGRPHAPPLGAPRAKLAPNRVLEDEED